MATRASDVLALESLLVQALSISDRLEHDRVGVHVASAIDALRRERALIPPAEEDMRAVCGADR